MDRESELRPTVRLDPESLKPSWPIIIASLEQLGSWATMALRLGVLALIQDCVRDLALYEADASGVVRLRELVEALAHMPFDHERMKPKAAAHPDQHP